VGKLTAVAHVRSLVRWKTRRRLAPSRTLDGLKPSLVASILIASELGWELVVVRACSETGASLLLHAAAPMFKEHATRSFR
jgi:hypothetical protein